MPTTQNKTQCIQMIWYHSKLMLHYASSKLCATQTVATFPQKLKRTSQPYHRMTDVLIPFLIIAKWKNLDKHKMMQETISNKLKKMKKVGRSMILCSMKHRKKMTLNFQTTHPQAANSCHPHPSTTNKQSSNEFMMRKIEHSAYDLMIN